MSDPPVSIYNLAMAELGEEPVIALTGASKAERLFIANWDLLRRELLEDGIWDFATLRVQLAADPTPPPFGNASRFLLPVDFLRLADLKMAEAWGWTVETSADGGKWLLTGAGAPIDLVYVRDVTDASQYSAKFATALGYKSAELLAPAITQSMAKQRNSRDRADAKTSEARLKDTQDDAPVEWDTDIWLRSRV